jgi:predicted Fe-Mo cluster-binding NifX family protein
MESASDYSRNRRYSMDVGLAYVSVPLDFKPLIAGNMGVGLVRRLEARGIKAILTPETDPDKTVAAYLDGSLVVGAAGAHEHIHDEESEHEHACHCGE